MLPSLFSEYRIRGGIFDESKIRRRHRCNRLRQYGYRVLLQHENREEGRNQEILDRAIRGRGAFRRFEDKVYDLGLEQKWYQYRDKAHEKIARQWCEENGIDIEE